MEYSLYPNVRREPVLAPNHATKLVRKLCRGDVHTVLLVVSNPVSIYPTLHSPFERSRIDTTSFTDIARAIQCVPARAYRCVFSPDS